MMCLYRRTERRRYIPWCAIVFVRFVLVRRTAISHCSVHTGTGARKFVKSEKQIYCNEKVAANYNNNIIVENIILVLQSKYSCGYMR